ncbi:DNA resolvase [Acidomonas methanolica]|uniref:DNA recombinase/resolvase n=2 Tax=Acidomonas methanolica TaxID=437 RepID=A0A023D746_ACIMT|nr:recombinase family protein [Acidomonas methanolica]TCS27353.1 DNA invertase Pin-like site-specific DNA recombinase [Acidomonas methanolica]GAJ29550.1 DNA recombinase/resolvase [Acidomonas methanolica NBRC 104435]GBQ47723.1 DNA resolvase [Acidomonas methanolica]GEK99621.1 DNA invertase [Acidomonas methanolica NBRC 104435]
MQDMGRKIGYARVSTVGQTLDSQIEQLHASGCHVVFREKISGAVAARAQLDSLIAQLEEGDVVIVTRIDRLARSTFDLFAIVQRIDARKAQFFSLSEPWADTSSSAGRLMLAVLGGVADVERDLIRIRTAEGRQRSIALGKRMGRPPLLSGKERDDMKRRRLAGASVEMLATEFHVSRSVVSRVCNGGDSNRSRRRPDAVRAVRPLGMSGG